MTVTLQLQGGATYQKTICHGEFVQVPLAAGETARAEIDPARGMDMGAGRGGRMVKEIRGGVVGVILDGRGRRPFDLPIDAADRINALQKWGAACEEYPDL